MVILVLEPFLVIDAGRERTSSQLISTRHLERRSAEDVSVATSAQTPLAHFFPEPEEPIVDLLDLTCHSASRPFKLKLISPMRDAQADTILELIEVENPFLRENGACTEQWLAIVGMPTRVGQTVSAWRDLFQNRKIEPLGPVIPLLARHQ